MLTLPLEVLLPTFADIEDAASRIATHVKRTPLLESPSLNAITGARVLVKPEGLQPTGSFKLRGAINRVATLSAEERRRGVVARSSGNHGQAIALAGAAVGVSVVVVVPTSAPDVKIRKIEELGARIVQVPMADLQEVATAIERSEGRVLVPPADDFHVVAGAGTVGKEIFEQGAEMNLRIDALVTCCSGGGLTAGCLLARDALSPATEVIAVEAEGFEKMARSLKAGQQMDLEPGGQSICDAINGLFTARIPFEIIRRTMLSVACVSDEQAMDAMQVAVSEFGLVVEPGGSVALAAALHGRIDLKGKIVVVILSGRNVEPELSRKAQTFVR